MLPKPIDQIGSEGFSALRIAPTLSGWPLDPFLHIELRHYHGADFPPRPKAGRICIHYAFPDSPSPILIRNNLNERHVVNPGCALISVTGKGMIEAVAALDSSQDALSLMVAFNLSAQNELQTPHTYMVTDLPDSHGEEMNLWGDQSPWPSPTPATIRRLRFSAGTRREITPEPGHNGVLICRKGIAKGWRAGDHSRIWEKPVVIEAIENCEFWWLSGQPLHTPVDLFGPFSMSDRLRNRLAAMQYRRGDWGDVASD